MVALRLIPCLDVANGRVVKGVNFVNLRDSGDPVELACRYSDEGADELVFLDIRASVENRNTLVDLVSRTAKSVKIPFTVGGGIDSVSSINDLLRAGADKVSLNSSAVRNPYLISESSREFGNQCIVIAIDARRKVDKTDEWEVYVKGGRENTGIDVLSWAKKVEELGAGEILLTSMDGDGTQNGYDLNLTESVANIVDIPVIDPLGLTLSEIKNAKSPVPQHKSAQSSPFKGSNKFTNFLFHNLCSPKLNRLFKKSYL